MAIHIVLWNFTDQGMKNIRESPSRLEAGIKAFEAAGGKMLGCYYTVGEYDLVTIGEIADENAGLAHTLAMNMLGNVKSVTMRAFTPAEFAKILAKVH
jgi:uncharacterized protein with GYD domain